MELNSENIDDGLENLSKDDLVNYLQNNLSNSEMHEVEKKILADDMNSDAFEGFESMPGAINGLDDLKTRFDHRIDGINKAVLRRNWIMGIISAILVVVGIIWLVVWLLNPEIGENNKINTNKILQKEVFEYEEYIKTMKLTEEQLAELDEINEATEIMKKDQIHYDEVSKISVNRTESNEILTSAYIDDEVVEDELPVEKIKFDEIEKPSTLPCMEHEVTNVSQTHFRNLLIVDYTKMKRREDAKLRPYLSGTGAQYANRQERNNNQFVESNVKYMSYVDFLNKALKTYIKEGYKRALMDFKAILEQYPSDINAHFYGGLCYYNIGKSDRAIEHFEYVINDTVNLFDEPAVYYKALSFLQKNDNNMASEIFSTIASDPCNHYNEKAKKKLDNIK